MGLASKISSVLSMGEFMSKNRNSDVTFSATERVNEDLPTPLYHQIYVLLREKVVSGDYAEGTLIPSEHELEKIFNVSRITAKRALDELAADGLVARQRGRGTVVTFSAPVPSKSAESMDGLLENLLTIVLETQVTIHEFDYVAAPPRAAEALEVPPSTKVQRAIRVRHKDDTPFSYVETYVPEDIGRSFKKEEMENQPLLALLERAGVKISRARQSITATLADGKTASMLSVNVGSPLLKVTRVVIDSNDRPVEFITVLYRPDLYQMNMTLSRVEGEDSNFWKTEH